MALLTTCPFLSEARISSLSKTLFSSSSSSAYTNIRTRLLSMLLWRSIRVSLSLFLTHSLSLFYLPFSLSRHLPYLWNELEGWNRQVYMYWLRAKKVGCKKLEEDFLLLPRVRMDSQSPWRRKEKFSLDSYNPQQQQQPQHSCDSFECQLLYRSHQQQQWQQHQRKEVSIVMAEREVNHLPYWWVRSRDFKFYTLPPSLSLSLVRI